MYKFVFLLVIVSMPVFAEGLKKVDYQDQSIESLAKSPEMGATLSPEDAKKLMEQVEIIKKKQEESRKALEELERDE